MHHVLSDPQQTDWDSRFRKDFLHGFFFFLFFPFFSSSFFFLFKCISHASHLPGKQEPDITLPRIPILKQSTENIYYANDGCLRNNTLPMKNMDLHFIYLPTCKYICVYM